MKKQVYKCALIFRGPQNEANEYFSTFVPMGMFNILKTLLNAGFHVSLYNLSNLKNNELKLFLKDLDAHIVFLSTFQGNHIESFRIASILKKNRPQTTIVVGGPFAVLGKEILNFTKEVDFVIQKEGEESAKNLILSLNNKFNLKNVSGLFYRTSNGVVSNKVFFTKNIDKFFYLPSEILPYCHYVNPENFSILITSRGCPYRCSFCSSPVLWENKIRYHSLDLLIKYIKDLRNTFGALYFSIRDDNLLTNKKRALEFAKMLEKERLFFLWNTQCSANFIDNDVAKNLHLAGCDQIQMGIESVSHRILKLLNKQIKIDRVLEAIKILRKNLIIPFGYFICGANENNDEIKENVKFLKNSGLLDGIVSPLVLYPSTEISKHVDLNVFFENKEIVYYNKDSFERCRNSYLKAIKYLSSKYFSLEEIKHNDKYHYATNITKFFYYKNKSEEKALKFLDEIIKKEPTNPWPHFLLGEHFEQKNFKKNAKKHYMIAQKILNGKNEILRKKLKEI